MNDIQLFRLRDNNLDIVSEYVEVEDEVVLVNPITISFETRGGRTTLYMEPWLPLTILEDPIVIIKQSEILFTAKIVDSVAQNYMDMTTKVLEAKVVFQKGTDIALEVDLESNGGYGDIHLLEDINMDGSTLQ